MTKLRIGLIGAGSMGSLHARVISASADCVLEWVSDPVVSSAQRVGEMYGTTPLNAPDLSTVDAVVVASPTQTHLDTARHVLENGKPLLLEKPVADELDDARAIVECSAAAGVPLMCGFLERFNPAVRTAFDITDEPVQLLTLRHSPYVERIRTGVASDLLIHDVDLVLRLFGEMPSSVKAVFNYSHPKSDAGSEDTVGVVLETPSGRLAELSASRLSQRKIRTMTITEVDRLIEIDLTRQDITIHRHIGLDVGEVDGLGYRQQSIIEVPVIRHQGEPLAMQFQRFIDIIEGRVDADAERDSILPAHMVVDQARRSAAA